MLRVGIGERVLEVGSERVVRSRASQQPLVRPGGWWALMCRQE